MFNLDESEIDRTMTMIKSSLLARKQGFEIQESISSIFSDKSNHRYRRWTPESLQRRLHADDIICGIVTFIVPAIDKHCRERKKNRCGWQKSRQTLDRRISASHMLFWNPKVPNNCRERKRHITGHDKNSSLNLEFKLSTWDTSIKALHTSFVYVATDLKLEKWDIFNKVLALTIDFEKITLIKAISSGCLVLSDGCVNLLNIETFEIKKNY